MTTKILDMNAAAFLAAASAATDGLTDYGDESFREPLQVLIDAVASEAQLTEQGLFGWQQRTLQLLGNRLRIQALVRKHPEVLQEPIEKPLIIVSMQRTGSTKLQNVLACDGYWHSPMMWEALFPAPLPGEKPGDPTPRIDAAKQWLGYFYAAIPQAMAGHAMAANQTEEETFAVEMSFHWTVAAVSAMIPSYIRWVETHSAVATYRDLKLLLQVWQWQRGTVKPWLLKSPWHIGFLDSLMQVFPDATVVQCHRDPIESAPSNCALMYMGRSIGCPTLDKIAHGADVLAMMGREMAMHLQQRETLGAGDPTIDVSYKDIVQDATGVVKKIYVARGEALSGVTERRIHQWERDNAQNKHGKWEYSAEEYGITRENVAAAFAGYYQRSAWFE